MASPRPAAELIMNVAANLRDSTPRMTRDECYFCADQVNLAPRQLRTLDKATIAKGPWSRLQPKERLIRRDANSSNRAWK